MKGQQNLELLLVFSIAIAIIASIFIVIFSFFPGLTSSTTVPSYSGFSGFSLKQVYLPSKSLYNIELQNMLNENIKIDKISLIVNGVNYTNFVCSKTYLQALQTTECNLSENFGNSFTGTGYIYYTPTNISFSPTIASRGNVIN